MLLRVIRRKKATKSTIIVKKKAINLETTLILQKTSISLGNLCANN